MKTRMEKTVNELQGNMKAAQIIEEIDQLDRQYDKILEALGLAEEPKVEVGNTAQMTIRFEPSYSSST